MKKKILLLSLLAVITLILFSFISTVSSNKTKTNDKNHVSPLFIIRANQATKKKYSELNSNFLDNRLFFQPFKWLLNRENLPLRMQLQEKNTCSHVVTCTPTMCSAQSAGCYPCPFKNN